MNLKDKYEGKLAINKENGGERYFIKIFYNPGDSTGPYPFTYHIIFYLPKEDKLKVTSLSATKLKRNYKYSEPSESVIKNAYRRFFKIIFKSNMKRKNDGLEVYEVEEYLRLTKAGVKK
ncbi:MAG: hypothetical protein ACOCRX_10675 [Candidatus Woesearchaeota archaeon]